MLKTKFFYGGEIVAIQNDLNEWLDYEELTWADIKAIQHNTSFVSGTISNIVMVVYDV